jgi:glycosyltransferase involved in cell wall biosynthesis
MVSGAALMVERLAEGMASRGHSVLVLTASDVGAPTRTETGNLTLVRFRSHRNPLRVGQRLSLWPHRKMLTALAAFAPDIIHSHDPLQYALSALDYSRGFKRPHVLTIHQLPWFVSSYLPDQSVLRQAVEACLWAYARWLLKKFSLVILPAQTTADIVSRQTGFVPKVVSNGVDTGIFHPGPLEVHTEAALRSRLGIPPGVPIILHLGRLDADKRADIAIQAAASSMQKSPAHLLVVGDGTRRPDLMRLCSELGIQGRSHFTGFVSPEGGLADIYRLATVFVTASEIENQSLVQLEVAASALPIVAVNAGGTPELVHHGVNGLLAEPQDASQLSAHLIWLLSNPGQAKAMGQAGRAFAMQHASQQTLAAHENLYRALLPATGVIPAIKAIGLHRPISG